MGAMFNTVATAGTESAIENPPARDQSGARSEVEQITRVAPAEDRIYGFPHQEADRLIVALEKMVMDGKVPVIITHRVPDLDAAGAALAMQALIREISQEKLGYSHMVPIYFEGVIPPELKELGFHGRGVSDLVALREQLGEQVGIVLVDSNDPNTTNVCGSIHPAKPLIPEVVVDHHNTESPGRERFIYTAGDSPNSTCGILFPAIQSYFAARGGLPETAAWKKVYSIMCAGVASDNNISLEADVAGIGHSSRLQIFGRLRELSDPEILKRLLNVPGIEHALEIARYDDHHLLADGRSLSKLLGLKVGIFSIGELNGQAEGRAVLGKAADQLRCECDLDLDITCAAYPAVTGATDEIALAISIRSNREVVDAGLMTRILFAPYGDGRPDAGGAQLSRAAIEQLIPELRLPLSGGLTIKELEQIYNYMKERLH
jgi:nanoRNase/pAp phosphatase (c-di-AMP/oligoRNAs hydrolase)